ncbi:hypothetical protein WJX74_006661 [Apatococcus lobatus]|uniref:Protein kinase domain-containing protein n=1 Tax=Apatococcus lobatus TaxID=904363 RepID=A0AAW1QTJ1_9CHLO
MCELLGPPSHEAVAPPLWTLDAELTVLVLPDAALHKARRTGLLQGSEEAWEEMQQGSRWVLRGGLRVLWVVQATVKPNELPDRRTFESYNVDVYGDGNPPRHLIKFHRSPGGRLLARHRSQTAVILDTSKAVFSQPACSHIQPCYSERRLGLQSPKTGAKSQCGPYKEPQPGHSPASRRPSGASGNEDPDPLRAQAGLQQFLKRFAESKSTELDSHKARQLGIGRGRDSCDGSAQQHNISAKWQRDQIIQAHRLARRLRHRQVYRGLMHQSTPVAIKIITEQTQKEKLQFVQEISILKNLRHTNIVQFTGGLIDAARIVLVTEFMARGDLWHALRSDTERLFAWSRRGRKVALDIVRGLVYMHSKSVVHLDIKSCNVLLSRDGVAKVADVGLARLLNREAPVGVQGTFEWAAPEVLLGRPCTNKADIYGLGVVLWEIITGEEPRARALRSIREDEAPADIVELVDACRALEPRDRPSSVAVFEAFISSNDSHLRRPPSRSL